MHHWKNIPSPEFILFAGMKFEPKPSTATKAALKPATAEGIAVN